MADDAEVVLLEIEEPERVDEIIDVDSSDDIMDGIKIRPRNVQAGVQPRRVFTYYRIEGTTGTVYRVRNKP